MLFFSEDVSESGRDLPGIEGGNLPLNERRDGLREVTGIGLGGNFGEQIKDNGFNLAPAVAVIEIIDEE